MLTAIFFTSFSLSFLVTYFLTPWIINSAKENNLTGIDLHKPDKPLVPKLGGLAFFFGILSALILAGIFPFLEERKLLGLILASTLGVIIGLVDDILTLEKRTLVLSTLFAGLPISIYKIGSPYIYATPFGPISLDPYFWFLVPFVFAYYCNSVNIYAGFNGLEAGLGFITSTSLGVCAIIYGSYESAFLLFSLSGALLAFLKYNWYPAKIFPGNSGTYLIGSVFAATIIAGTLKTVGLIATFPYFINFILRLKDRLRWTVGEMNDEGLIYSDKICALWAVFIRKPTKEKNIVLKCLILQLLFGGLAISYAILNRVIIYAF